MTISAEKGSGQLGAFLLETVSVFSTGKAERPPFPRVGSTLGGFAVSNTAKQCHFGKNGAIEGGAR